MGEKMNDTNAFITARTLEALAARPGERLVEIGPGNGLLSLPVVEALGAAGHYTGLEMSAEMARQAEANLTRAGGPAIEIQHGDCMAAAFESDSIDGLYAVNVLYFIEDLAGFFDQVSRWLKPGGRAVFGLRSEKSLTAMPFTDYGFRIRPLEEITGLLKAKGFDQVTSDYYDEGTSKLGDLEIPVDSLIAKAVAA